MVFFGTAFFCKNVYVLHKGRLNCTFSSFAHYNSSWNLEFEIYAPYGRYIYCGKKFGGDDLLDFSPVQFSQLSTE